MQHHIYLSVYASINLSFKALTMHKAVTAVALHSKIFRFPYTVYLIHCIMLQHPLTSHFYWFSSFKTLKINLNSSDLEAMHVVIIDIILIL